MVIPYALFVLLMAANSAHPPWQDAYVMKLEPCTIHTSHQPCARVHVRWNGPGSVFGS